MKPVTVERRMPRDEDQLGRRKKRRAVGEQTLQNGGERPRQD